MPVSDGGQSRLKGEHATIPGMQQKFPGREVVTVFRTFIAIRLGIALVSALTIYLRQGPRLAFFETSTLITLVETSLLLAYLWLPGLQKRLGGWYLPIGLAAATLGPIVANMFLLQSFFQVAILGPSPQPMFAVEVGQQVMVAGQFQLSILLLVPLILVSWLYSFRSTLFYVLGVALLDASIPLLIAGATYFSVFRIAGEIVLRSVIFVFLGYLINRLVAEQKRQNSELAEANRRLASYATTLEQLTVSHERNRLAREFHDTLAHTLSAVAVQLEGVSALQHTNPQKAEAMLEHSLTMTRDGLNESRRAIQALRAAPLEDLGLRTAIEALARTSAERYGWGLNLELPEEISGISMEAEHCIYRIVEEALRNAGQHAGARRLELSLTRANGRVELKLHDDGRGFEYDPAALDDRYGLRGMLERAAAIGAELEIVSRPGQGARLRMVLEAPS